jgi:hypothetical protein
MVCSVGNIKVCIIAEASLAGAALTTIGGMGGGSGVLVKIGVAGGQRGGVGAGGGGGTVEKGVERAVVLS